jgi:surface protein
MTISDNLNRIINAKANIKKSIENKGVEVSDNALLDEYPALIDSIPMEGGDPYYEELFNQRTNNGTSMSALFKSCNASQLDLSKLNTSKVTDMNYMFSYCSSQITLGNWNLSNLLYTDYMFQGFNNSSNYIDLSILDFSNVTSISYMFESCNLNYVDIRNLNFDWSKVTNLYGMFCYVDGVLDLSNWDITGLTNMNSMIYSYYGKKIDLTNWITTSVTDMSSNFCDCPNLEELIIPDWDMTNAPGSSMFSGCNNLRYVDISRCNEFTIAEITALLPEKTLDNFGTIKVPENTSQEVCDTLIAKYWKPVGVAISTVPTSCNIAAELDELMPSGSTKVYITPEPWYADTSKIELVVSDNSMATITDDNEVISTGVVGNIELAARLIDTQEIISTKTIVVSETDSHPGLIKIRLNPNTYGSTQINNSSHYLEIWNWTQEANNIYSYDIGDTITDIYFGYYITELIRVNTSNITSAINMFNNTLLQKFNARNFDTSNITEMSGMFANCYELIELDLSSFNTSNVTNMGSMFRDCSNLTILDISNFNTQFASLGDMFYNCSNLHTIRMDNCSYTTIFEIIHNASIPTNAINGVIRTIYCKEENAAGLTPPTNWVFSYVD